MPIEIRELTIRATIESTGENSLSAGSQNGSGRMEDEAIQEIVDRVIEVIERKQER